MKPPFNSKNHLLFFFFISLFSSIKSFAQSEFKCRDTDHNNEYYNQVKEILIKSPGLRNQVKYPVKVALSINITRNSDGSGGISEGKIYEALEHLNQVYAQSTISFYLLNNKITYIDNTRYYNFTTNDEKVLTDQYDVNNAVNVYLVNSFVEGMGGYAYFPSQNKNTNRVFSIYSDFEDMKVKILPHEFGHYFGLFHTFQDSGSSDEEYVTRGEKANCETNGDLLCDTPADPYGRVIFLGGIDCNFNYDIIDRNGDKYAPMTSNIMSYYRNCGNILTIGQYELMSFGISKRLAPSAVEKDRYSILGLPFSEKDKIFTGEITTSNGTGIGEFLCRTKEYQVKYSGESVENVKVEAWLISNSYKIRKKIGSGTSSPIKLDLSNLPEILEDFQIQIVTDDESRFGTFSNGKYRLLEIPQIELSNVADEFFEGESATLKGKINTQNAKIEIQDETGTKRELLFNRNSKFVEIDFPVQKTSVFTVSKIENQCGVGTATGSFKVNILDVPLSKIVKIYSAENYWCQAKPKTFNLVGFGKIPDIEKVYLTDTLGYQLAPINDFRLNKNQIEIQTNTFADLPDIIKLKIIFKNGNESFSDPVFLAKNINHNISQSLITKRGKNNGIRLKGYFVPTTIEFTNNFSINVSGYNPEFSIKSNENLNLSIVRINNQSCQMVSLSGELNLKINEILDFDLIREENACVDKIYQVNIKNVNSFLDHNAHVVFFDESHTERARTKIISIENNKVSFKIPLTVTNPGYYYLRLLSLDSSASKKTNKFYINTLPNVKISGIYGKKYLNETIIKEISGTFPIEVSFSNGYKFNITEENQNLNLEKFNNGKHSIISQKNICGVNNLEKYFFIDKDLSEPNCIPQSKQTTSVFLPISKLFIQEASTNKTIYFREDWSQTSNGYSENKGGIIYLKKNKLYNFTIDLITSKNLGWNSTNSTYTNVWIDFNNNGNFEVSEKIFSSSNIFTFTNSLIIPENTQIGNKLMRIQTMNLEDKNEDPCLNQKPTETEDYVVNIQEPNAETPSISINLVSNSIICVDKEISFNIEGNLINTNFLKGYLKDKWGNTLQNLGKVKYGFNKFLINVKVDNKEYLYIAVEDEFNYIATNSNLFNVIIPPKIKFFGESYSGKNQKANVFYSMEGGYSTYVNLNVSDLSSAYYVYDSYYKNSINSFIVNLSNSAKVFPIQITDRYCNSGTFEGYTEITLDNEPYLNRTHSLTSAYGSVFCNGNFNFTSEVSSNSTSSDNIFFSVLLKDNNGKYYRSLGNFKKSKFTYKNEEKLPSGMNPIVISSNNPLSEFYSNAESNSFAHNINLQRLNDLNYQNENAFFEVRGNTQRFYFKQEGFNQSSEADAFKYRFSQIVNEKNDIGVILSSNYCNVLNSNSNISFQGLKSKKNDLRIIADNQACRNGRLKIPVYFTVPFEKDNYFEYRILDKNGTVLKIGKAELKNDYLEIEKLDFNSSDQTFKLAVNSSNPYTSSNVTEEFKIFPESSAELSSDLTTKKLYEGTPIPYTINFKGTGPWEVILNNNEKISNITESPFKSKIIAQNSIDSLYIKSLNSFCGQGNAKGLATYQVYELPKIEIAAFSNDTLCKNLPFELEYATTKGKFLQEPRLSLKLYNSENEDDNVLLKSSNSESGSFSFNLPANVQKGKKYFFRILNNDPEIESNKSIPFLVETPPIVGFGKELRGFEGYTYPLSLFLNTISPSLVEIENFGSVYSIKSNLALPVQLTKNTSYRIKSVRNRCGSGTIVNPELVPEIIGLEQASELLTIAPNPVQNNGVSLIYLKDELFGIPLEVNIFDTKGKNIGAFAIDPKMQIQPFLPINFSFLQKGTYFVYFSNSKISFVKKIIVL